MCEPNDINNLQQRYHAKGRACGRTGYNSKPLLCTFNSRENP